MQDWQIAAAAEEEMQPIASIARGMGLRDSEIIPMGRNVAKIKSDPALSCRQSKGKLIAVTAITPTIFGEGKTTATIGLVQALGLLGKSVSGAIRQPSSGPTFNIKGSAAGGGYAQCIPLGPFSIRLTGDIDSITNAHNLAMVALNARMQHERNYDDSRLLKSNLRRLNIDPKQIYWQWAMDFCAQGLRHITMGLGGKMDGYKMRSGFQISVSSEVMAILSIAADLADLRERMAHIVLAKSTSGADITAHDLEVDGAMTAFLTDAIHPNLLQTIEGQPIFVHGGPFANIAIGQSSIIADRLGLALSDYHVTESGFGADIGYEKFWNLKCRLGGYQPSAVVIVATIRALKEHGKNTENCLKYGCANLLWHIKIVQKSGISPVVCINKFKDDKEEELNYIKRIAEGAGATAAIADHWAQGGKGATRLAKAVLAETEKPNSFAYLYDAKEPLREQIERIATGIYGSCGVTFSKKAKEKLKELEGSKLLPCIAKTHLSLTHDPKIKIPPAKWKLPIRDILTYKGAGFAVPVAGEIKLMPGTGSDPAFRRIDVDVKTGKITGLY